MGAASQHLGPAHRGPQLCLFHVSIPLCLPVLLMALSNMSLCLMDWSSQLPTPKFSAANPPGHAYCMPDTGLSARPSFSPPSLPLFLPRDPPLSLPPIPVLISASESLSLCHLGEGGSGEWSKVGRVAQSAQAGGGGQGSVDPVVVRGFSQLLSPRPPPLPPRDSKDYNHYSF